MLIGQLSKLSGFSRDTIRYYEKIALIELPKAKRRENNYKDYPPDVLERLRVIRKYKELGFTLEEIRELLVLQSIKVLDVSKVLQIMEIKITGIDEQIEKLHAYRMKLSEERTAWSRQERAGILELPQMKQAA